MPAHLRSAVDTMTSVPPVPSGARIKPPVLRLVPTAIVPTVTELFRSVITPAETVSELAMMPASSIVGRTPGQARRW
jgi:hypothetical protein